MDRFYDKDGKHFKETKWVQIVSFNKAKLDTGDSPWGFWLDHAWKSEIDYSSVLTKAIEVWERKEKENGWDKPELIIFWKVVGCWTKEELKDNWGTAQYTGY
jgi:hypothetical protein